MRCWQVAKAKPSPRACGLLLQDSRRDSDPLTAAAWGRRLDTHAAVCMRRRPNNRQHGLLDALRQFRPSLNDALQVGIEWLARALYCIGFCSARLRGNTQVAYMIGGYKIQFGAHRAYFEARGP